MRGASETTSIVHIMGVPEKEKLGLSSQQLVQERTCPTCGIVEWENLEYMDSKPFRESESCSAEQCSSKASAGSDNTI